MSRLIDVDALINEIKKETEKAIKQDDRVGAFWLGYFAGLVLKQPTVQPERKMGRWIPDNRPSGGFWVCSECKFPSEAFAANVLYKFCPNCGADMRGEQDDNHE